MDPIKLFTVIALVSLPTVMYGGYSLLRLTKDRKLTAVPGDLLPRRPRARGRAVGPVPGDVGPVGRNRPVDRSALARLPAVC